MLRMENIKILDPNMVQFYTHISLIPNTVAAVVIVGASIPTVSIELASGINPYRDTRPYVGLTPTTPQKAAGSRTEPPVSVPRALKKRHTK